MGDTGLGTGDNRQGRQQGRGELVVCSTRMGLCQRPFGTGGPAPAQGGHIPVAMSYPESWEMIWPSLAEPMGLGIVPSPVLPHHMPNPRGCSSASPCQGAASLQHLKTGAGPRAQALGQSHQPWGSPPLLWVSGVPAPCLFLQCLSIMCMERRGAGQASAGIFI